MKHTLGSVFIWPGQVDSVTVDDDHILLELFI